MQPRIVRGMLGSYQTVSDTSPNDGPVKCIYKGNHYWFLLLIVQFMDSNLQLNTGHTLRGIESIHLAILFILVVLYALNKVLASFDISNSWESLKTLTSRDWVRLGSENIAQ
jgi:hypothetical protein